MPNDIFVSYASEDASKAAELVRTLESDGWSVWWDREVKPGQDFESEIDQALNAARAVIVLWSQHSVGSTWVRSEAKEAKELNKMIPVLLDEARIPLTYRALNTIDLTSWPDSPALIELSRLKSAVSRVALQGTSAQPLKKQTSVENATLSVRVAERVAKMVINETNGSDTATSPAFNLERCIADICLNIVASRGTLEELLPGYLTHLAHALSANHTVIAEVHFGSGSVSELRGIDGSPPPAEVERAIFEFINDHCSAVGDGNLDITEHRWQSEKPLCLPLAGGPAQREYAFFVASGADRTWSYPMQGRLVKLAAGFEAAKEKS